MFRMGSSILKDKSRSVITPASTHNAEGNRNVQKPGDRGTISPKKVQKVTPTRLKFRSIPPIKRKQPEPQIGTMDDEGFPSSPIITKRHSSVVRDDGAGKIMHGRICDKVQDHQQAHNQSGRSDTSSNSRGYGDNTDLISGNIYNRNRILQPDPVAVACSSITKDFSASGSRNRFDLNSNQAAENYRGGGERLASAKAFNIENRNPDANGRSNLGSTTDDIARRFESQQAKFSGGGHNGDYSRDYGSYRSHDGHDRVHDRDRDLQARSMSRQLDYGQQRDYQQPLSVASTSRGFRDERFDGQRTDPGRGNDRNNYQKGYSCQEDYGHGLKRSMQNVDAEYLEPDIAALITEYRQVMKQRFQAKKARIERNFTVVRTPEILFKTQEILAATRKHKAAKYEAALTRFRTKVDGISKTHNQNAVTVQKMAQSIQKGVKKITEEIQNIKIGMDECVESMQKILQDYTTVILENKKKSIAKLDKKFHKWEEKVIETVQTSTTDILQIYLKHL